MAIKVMTRVWDLSKQTNGNMLLLLAIADHADDDGVCWPSLDRLAEKTRVKKRQAIRNVQALEAAGELFIESGGGRHIKNRYFVTVGLGSEEIQRVLITRFKMAPDSARQTAETIVKHQNGVIRDTVYNEGETVSSVVKTVSSKAQNGVIDDTRTVIEPSSNHQLGAAAENAAATQFEDLLPASPTNGRKLEHDSLLAQIQNGSTEQANQARLIALGLAAKEQAPTTGLEQIKQAGWNIKDDRIRQGMAVFLEAVPLPAPVSRGERGQWLKGISAHLEEFGLSGLKELYHTAWNEYLPDITSGKLDITHPLALTRKMRGIRSRPQPVTQEVKYFIDPDTGERIKW